MMSIFVVPVIASEVLKLYCMRHKWRFLSNTHSDSGSANADMFAKDYCKDHGDQAFVSYRVIILQADDRAVRRYGSKDEDTGAGWLGAAASFLAKSFYW